MTSPAETTAPDEATPPAVDPEATTQPDSPTAPRDERPAGGPPPRRWPPAWLPSGALPFAAAVLVPFALFTWRALRAPVNFDGGMNLQVAQSLADGDGYARFYNQVLPFPHEVQTNGPFIYLAALAIKVFGENQFAYQFASLVSIGLLAAAVFLFVRDRPILRVVGPLAVLLTLPGVSNYGLGALGEIPMSALLLGAVLALAEAVRRPERAPWWAFAASAAFGAAFATKTFANGAVVGLGVGVLCTLVAVPTRRGRLLTALGIAAGAPVVLGLRELHRLVGLASIGEYRDWWAEEREFISSQSGLDNASGGGPVETVLDHLAVLSKLVYFPDELLAIALVLPFVAVAGLLVWHGRKHGLRQTMTDPAMVVFLAVSGIAGAYLGWWMLLVPENKLWVRRILPALLAIAVLYLLLVPYLARAARAALRRWRAAEAPIRSRWLPAAAVVGVVVLAAISALPYAVKKVDGNTRALVEGEPAWLDHTEDAAGYVADHDDERFFGDDWWSAPVVSLMADTGFYDLSVTDPCTLRPERDRLVWDRDAKLILRPDPWTRDGLLAFEEVASFGTDITIYAVGPGPAAPCG